MEKSELESLLEKLDPNSKLNQGVSSVLQTQHNEIREHLLSQLQVLVKIFQSLDPF